MKQAIRQHALDLGFDDCRFASSAPPDGALHFLEWLASQYHGTMAYLHRQAAKRIDPQQLLPGAKSVVVLAADYSRSPLRAPDQPPVPAPTAEITEPDASRGPGSSTDQSFTGLIARYARYADYHQLLGSRLEALVQWIHQRAGSETRSRWYVDTGPVLERDLAQRAGLGFMGKHTNLISRRGGNWILLAEILTTLKLEPDPPESNHCGTCTRCLAACPTQAIVAPFRLDARKCISYLTIENRGPIPEVWRPAMGTRIFGCDDCLAVCPWNRFTRAGRIMSPHARPDLAAPDLLELLALDEEGFRRRFSGTPLERVRRRGLVRNVCVALGNRGDTRALPALRLDANSTDALIGEHARWAITQIENRLLTEARNGSI